MSEPFKEQLAKSRLGKIADLLDRSGIEAEEIHNTNEKLVKNLWQKQLEKL